MSKSGYYIKNASLSPVTVAGEENTINENITPYELTAFRLQNFKAFRDTDWIRLNYLTLVLGKNSVGKSALYQVLRMLKTAYEQLNRLNPFPDLRGFADQAGTYEDIYNKNTLGDVAFSFRFDAQKEKERPLIYRVSLRNSDEHEYGMVYSVTLSDGQKAEQLLNYYRSINIFFLEQKSNVSVPAQVEKHTQYVMSALRRFAEKIQIISAHRMIPRRVMQMSGTQETADIGEDGGKTYEMLFSLGELKDSSVDMVNNWLSKFGYTYRWEMHGKNRGEFMLRNIRTHSEINLADTGFGIAQSLPIATAIMTMTDNTVLLDSPEAFLQTDMQAAMGDLLLSAADSGRLIAETGSEYLLLRICRRIAEGKVNPEKIHIYFIEEQTDGNAICHFVGINRDGELQNEPDALKRFFSGDFEDIEAIQATKRDRYKRGIFADGEADCH